MLLTDITQILRVLLVAFGTVASQDALTQRRVGQIGEVIGAVEDVAEDEEEKDSTVAQKRVDEAHDIIHRVAAILAMEDEGNEGAQLQRAIPARRMRKWKQIWSRKPNPDRMGMSRWLKFRGTGRWTGRPSN